MFGLLDGEEALLPVRRHPRVVEAMEKERSATGEADKLEAEELALKRRILVADSSRTERPATDEEREEAWERLKPPHPGVTIPAHFVLPEARAARKAADEARRVRERVEEECVAQLRKEVMRRAKALTDKLAAAVAPALRVAEEIQALSVESGIEFRHPVPELLPDGNVPLNLAAAKEKAWA